MGKTIHWANARRFLLRVLIPWLSILLSTAGITLSSSLFPNPILEVAVSPFLADFNRDGNIDLLDCAGMMFLGDGDGGFERAPDLDTTCTSMVRDFNRDEVPDLVGTDSSGLFIRFGVGDGTFSDRISLGVQGDLSWVADFNGDDRDDLLVIGSVDCGSARISVLAGLGGGAFASPIVTDIAPKGFVATGDWNGDGRQDIALADTPRGTDVSFYLANGDFTFRPGSTFPNAGGLYDFLTYSIRWMTSGDFDGDGLDDLVTTAAGHYGGFGTCVLRSNGDGSFERAVGGDPFPGCYRDSDFTSFVTTADLNGDGKLDLVVADKGAEFAGFQSGDVFILVGKGDSSFDPELRLGTALGAERLAIADLNHDGRQDIVVGGTRPAVLLASGDGTSFRHTVANDTFSSVVASDFNGDGQTDLAVSTGVFLGLGDGTFTSRQPFVADLDSPVVAADFNGDGTVDLAGLRCKPTDAAEVALILGLGDGSFNAPSFSSAGACGELIVSDINLDGSPDLLTLDSLLLNQGDGTFGPAIRLDTGPADRPVGTGDFNSDGSPDLVVGSCNPNGFSVRFGNRDGTFGASFWTVAMACVRHAAVTDFNQDGRSDIVVAENANLEVFLNKGDGSFTEVLPTLEFMSYPLRPVTGDFNADERQDIAVVTLHGAGGQYSDVSILLGKGNGTFEDARRFDPGSSGFMTVGDFNGDRRSDLAVIAKGLKVNRVRAGPVLSILLNQGPFPNRPPVAVARTDSQTECTSPAGALVTLDGTGSIDPDSTPGTTDDIAAFEWFADFGLPTQVALGSGETVSVGLPLGQHVITLKITDRAGASNTSEVVAAVADTTPPTLSIDPVPAVLWPPNHHLVPVTALVSASDACGPISPVLHSVVSSEADDAPGGGDGHTTGDIEGAIPDAPAFTFRLRAERAATGPGRVYTVTYQAQDRSGNIARTSATVVVPLSRTR